MSARKFDIDRTKKFGNVKVTVTDASIVCRLHNTDVATYDKASLMVTLNNGGWKTVTTKTAINTFLKKLGLPMSVYQTKGNWQVFIAGTTHAIPFEDGMRLAANGAKP